jgi:hypothetical protein
MVDEAALSNRHAEPRQAVLQRKFHVSGRNSDQLETRIDAFAAALEACGGAILQVKRRAALDARTWHAAIRYTFPARGLRPLSSAGVARGAA